MYSIEVIHPAETTRGRVARNVRYKVNSIHGGSTRSMTAGQLCKEQGLSLAAMLKTVRYWPPGWHTEDFQALVDKMRVRLRGSYGRQGRKLACPSCGVLHHKNDYIFAGRRARRDASPLNSSLRARPPEYFGEQTTTDVVAPAATTEAESEGITLVP